MWELEEKMRTLEERAAEAAADPVLLLALDDTPLTHRPEGRGQFGARCAGGGTARTTMADDTGDGLKANSRCNRVKELIAIRERNKGQLAAALTAKLEAPSTGHDASGGDGRTMVPLMARTDPGCPSAAELIANFRF
jgi:hypothetical protein